MSPRGSRCGRGTVFGQQRFEIHNNLTSRLRRGVPGPTAEPLEARGLHTNNLHLWRHSGTVVHRPASLNNLHRQFIPARTKVLAKTGGYALSQPRFSLTVYYCLALRGGSYKKVRVSLKNRVAPTAVSRSGKPEGPVNPKGRPAVGPTWVVYYKFKKV